jgi:hypothetical protein
MNIKLLNITNQVGRLQGVAKTFYSLMEHDYNLNYEEDIKAFTKDNILDKKCEEIYDYRVNELTEYLEEVRGDIDSILGEIHREIRKQKPEFYNTNEKLPF